MPARRLPTTMSLLFTPLSLRQVSVRNRAWVSPMCQYSAVDGLPNTWHLVHLGQFATGGAGLVLTEATAVTPDGRISPEDTGIWSDAQAAAWEPIVAFVRAQGASVGMQLAHAGRKASTFAPWRGRGTVPLEQGGWPTVAPSAVAFEGYAEPRASSIDEVEGVVTAFADAAERAVRVGFQVLEIHAAHGYLLHEFLSPLSNRRDDRYGGSFDNRIRLLLEVVDAVRARVDDGVPLLVRVSATDWADNGWDADQTVALAAQLADHGVDLVDVSSGGLVGGVQIPVGPGYQAPFAHRIRAEAGLATGAVGMITDPKQAEDILADGSADAVLLARELLRDPHWPLRAAAELGDDVAWPDQYVRARTRP
jgi:2,4-dienoyl-CoA reductase-like NADH-dependent reductase (Old Yellow Enzyme family)